MLRVKLIVTLALAFCVANAFSAEAPLGDREWTVRANYPKINHEPFINDALGPPVIWIETFNFFEIFVTKESRSEPFHSLALAIWSDGRVIYSPDFKKIGSPLAATKLSQESVANLIAYIQSAGYFDDGVLNEHLTGLSYSFKLTARNEQNKYLIMSVERDPKRQNVTVGKNKIHFDGILSKIESELRPERLPVTLGAKAIDIIDVKYGIVHAKVEKNPEAKKLYPGLREHPDVTDERISQTNPR